MRVLVFGEGVDGKGRQNYTHFLWVWLAARSNPQTTMAEQSINKPGGQGGECNKLKSKLVEIRSDRVLIVSMG